MSENMEAFRHLDGGGAIVDQPYMHIVFQHGNPSESGVNGCRVEDVIEALIQKLLDFQGRSLACPENAEALEGLAKAQEALLKRRSIRERQHVLGTHWPHSEDATGSSQGLAVLENRPLQSGDRSRQ